MHMISHVHVPVSLSPQECCSIPHHLLFGLLLIHHCHSVGEMNSGAGWFLYSLHATTQHHPLQISGLTSFPTNINHKAVSFNENICTINDIHGLIILQAKLMKYYCSSSILRTRGEKTAFGCVYLHSMQIRC